MKRVMILLTFMLGLIGQAIGAEKVTDGAITSRRSLTVSLYPYIPDSTGAYWAIREAFETRYPEITLRVNLHPDYYNHEEKDGRPLGILGEEADVYELDSVLLADAAAAGKIRALDDPSPDVPLIPFSVSATEWEGRRWGVPHWVCGNFLFYRAGDNAIGAARTLADVESAIGRSPPPNRSLLLDLKGKSTLGEMYLDALLDREGSLSTALPKMLPTTIDPGVAMAIGRTAALLAPGLGRDDDYHKLPGFYARQFARGYGRGFVGYSEQTYYMLSEAWFSCRKDEGCLKPADVRISEWPAAARGSQPIAWVDVLAIDAKLTGEKLEDARRFVSFMMETATYKLLLKPTSPAPPRYLLPARDDLYRDSELIDQAPLYPSFRRAMDRAVSVTAKNLNTNLRLIGAWFDRELRPN